MKTVKIIATALLGVLLFVSLLALQALLVVRYTVLAPVYYGAPQRQVYQVLSEYAVRTFSDLVVDRAPPEALRTTDRAAVYALAQAALPGQMAEQTLQDAMPKIVRYVLQGGAPPLLGDPDTLNGSGLDMLGAVLKDGALLFIPAAQRPRLTDYLPFTPTWNAANAAHVDALAEPLRMAWVQRDNILWIAAGIVVFVLAFLYMLWMRSPRPFYLLCGWMLLGQGTLWAALALALRFFHGQLVTAVLQLPALQSAALSALQPGFLSALPNLVAAALNPFSAALAMGSAIIFSFSMVCFAMATERGAPLAAPKPHFFRTIVHKLRTKPAQ